VGGLEDTVGVHVLIATTGHTEGVPGLLLVGVDVLITEVELAELVLGVELAGGSGRDGNGNRSNGSRDGSVEDRSGGSLDKGGGVKERSRGSLDKGGGVKERSRGRLDKGGGVKERSRGSLDKGSGLDDADRGGQGSSKGRGLDNLDRCGNRDRGSNRDRGGVDKDRGSGDLVVTLNGLSLALLPLNHSRLDHNSGLGISVSGKVGSAGSSNLRGLGDREGPSNSSNLRGGGHSDRQVGGSNSESVDRVRDVVGGLEDTVGVHVLIATTGHTEGVPGLLLVGVDVLVTKVELAELVLGVELAGGVGGHGNRHCHWGGHGVNSGNRGGHRDRGGYRDRGSHRERGSHGSGGKGKGRGLDEGGGERSRMNDSRGGVNDLNGEGLEGSQRCSLNNRGDGDTVACVQGDRGHAGNRQG